VCKMRDISAEFMIRMVSERLDDTDNSDYFAFVCCTCTCNICLARIAVRAHTVIRAHTCFWFLSHDAILVQYLLSSCVRPSVYHKPVPGYHIETIGRIELVFGMEASTCLTLCYKEIWVSSKIRVLPSGTLSQTPDLKNLVTISRPRCQQNLSSSLSTVEPVDDTYTTIIISFGCLLQVDQAVTL